MLLLFCWSYLFNPLGLLCRDTIETVGYKIIIILVVVKREAAFLTFLEKSDIKIIGHLGPVC